MKEYQMINMKIIITIKWLNYAFLSAIQTMTMGRNNHICVKKMLKKKIKHLQSDV